MTRDAATQELADGPAHLIWRVLDLCHNKSNLGEYEGLLQVDLRLVTDLIKTTQKVADAFDASLWTLKKPTRHEPKSSRRGRDHAGLDADQKFL